MHKPVIDIFPAFTKPLEGCVLWPYLDILGLVTVGYGCLADPESLAAAIPGWYLSTPNVIAGPGAVAQEWAKLKARQDLKKLHFNYAQAVTMLRLTQDGADKLLSLRMQVFEGTLRHYFPQWDLFPADAQLAIMAIAWACGAGFPATFKNFSGFANRFDWENAAKCAAINANGNPGIVPRNAQIALCLANAAAVDANAGAGQHDNGDALYWPNHVPSQNEQRAAADNVIRIAAFQALEAHPIDVLGYAGRGNPFEGHESDSLAA